MEPSRDRWLNRGNTRNVILLLCLTAVLLKPTPGWHVAIAAVLLAIGTALHVLVKGSLIRNTTLCRSGPYRLCRHPYYLANFIIDASFCLLTGNPYVLVLLPFLFFWGYGPSLRAEETLLLELHGQDYLRFTAETPQLLPDASPRHWARALCLDFAVQRLSLNEIRRGLRFWGDFLGLLALECGWAAARSGGSPVGSLLLPTVGLPGAVAVGLLLTAAVLPRNRFSHDEVAADSASPSTGCRIAPHGRRMLLTQGQREAAVATHAGVSGASLRKH